MKSDPSFARVTYGESLSSDLSLPAWTGRCAGPRAVEGLPGLVRHLDVHGWHYYRYRSGMDTAFENNHLLVDIYSVDSYI
jgi:hypothetical protein